MADIFPTLSSGSVAAYPVRRTTSVATKKVRFLDDTEQRWRTVGQLDNWSLSFQHLKLVDIETLRTFFYARKGRFDSTWTFAIDGSSYTLMAFDQDAFSYAETGPGIYSTELKIIQTQQAPVSLESSLVYPTLSSGAKVQYPFQSNPSYLTTVNDMPHGKRYAYYWRSTPLYTWQLQYSVITDAEAAILLDFFISAGGMYHAFSFTDPETLVTHAKCRFGMQSLTRGYDSPGVGSMTILIEETA